MKVPTIAPASLLDDPMFTDVKERIVSATGLAYYLNQEHALAAHLATRLTKLQISELSAYIERLSDAAAGEAEWDALVAELTIGETFFFRHREQFDALRDRVFPDLIARNQRKQQLRIWSAGCATGAEAYSIAILLKQAFGAQITGWDVTILGTDINREFLARAHRGEFPDWAFRSSLAELKQSCFTPLEKGWAIRPEFKEGVSFQYHNLVQHPFPSLVNNLSNFDVILCRNVMIYFQPEIVKRLIMQFHGCLVDGGWLLVGHAESSVENFRSFHTVNAPGAVLYQNRTSAPTTAMPAAAGTTVRNCSTCGGNGVPQFRTKTRVPRRSTRRTSAIDTTSQSPVVAISTKSAAEQLAEIREKADRADWHSASELCEKLVAAERLNPLAHFYSALVWEQLGRYVEADAALRRAIYLDRKFVLAHYHLGLLLQKHNDLAGAQRFFRNAMQLLDGMDNNVTFEDADGLTVGILKRWTETNLEVLGGP